MSKWQRLSGKIVYQNNYMSVHEDEVIAPDGRATVYGWIETPPAVFIVALGDQDRVCLVEQERYTTGAPSWEIPAGNTDGEDDTDAAKRELAEEAGLHADKWERLPVQTYPFNGFAAERNIIFIATGLHQVREPVGATDDTITAKRWVSWPELKKMLSKGEITDAQTISAVMLAGLHLGHIK
ncbi:MAG TPA: NUDIX hydrolase [Candidatus Saccharimonadia bacterium]|nr:NUDIX hydrolase [Candidatus Saccharimonadia bacterium]